MFWGFNCKLQGKKTVQCEIIQMLMKTFSVHTLILKVLYRRQCQYTQANEYHFDGANSIETTNH